jgi:hypothetical protein
LFTRVETIHSCKASSGGERSHAPGLSPVNHAASVAPIDNDRHSVVKAPHPIIRVADDDRRRWQILAAVRVAQVLRDIRDDGRDRSKESATDEIKRQISAPGKYQQGGNEDHKGAYIVYFGDIDQKALFGCGGVVDRSRLIIKQARQRGYNCPKYKTQHKIRKCNYCLNQFMVVHDRDYDSEDSGQYSCVYVHNNT